MFLVHLIGSGQGCDYTIGCNQLMVVLPDTIKTMRDAVEYVAESEGEGSLSHYGHYDTGLTGRIDSATVYEFKESQVIDAAGLARMKKHLSEIQQFEKDRMARRKEYETLKAEFG